MTSVLACDNDGGARPVPPPAVDDTVGYNPNAGRQLPSDYDVQARQEPQPQQRSGMSSRTKKLVVLAGAAALYYLYKKHKNATEATGPESQYYLSKNGRVYYRDAQHRAHWVTPPPQGITVPEDEAAEYRDLQGYDNRATGRDLRDIASQGAY